VSEHLGQKRDALWLGLRAKEKRQRLERAARESGCRRVAGESGSMGEEWCCSCRHRAGCGDGRLFAEG
jgi:hypothetical protein